MSRPWHHSYSGLQVWPLFCCGVSERTSSVTCGDTARGCGWGGYGGTPYTYATRDCAFPLLSSPFRPSVTRTRFRDLTRASLAASSTTTIRSNNPDTSVFTRACGECVASWCEHNNNDNQQQQQQTHLGTRTCQQRCSINVFLRQQQLTNLIQVSLVDSFNRLAADLM